MKILIIQTAFIGDVVLATPVIEKLHQHFPDGTIDFLLRKGNENLLTSHPKLHLVLIWDKKQSKIRHLFQLIRQIRAERYDLVVNLQRFFGTGLMTALSGAHHTIGYRKNPLSWFFSERLPHQIGDGTHEVARNLRLISRLTDIELVKPRLYLPASALEKTAPLKQQPYLTIAPTSVWFTKQFPTHKWVEFLQKTSFRGKVYLLGAPSDFENCEVIRTESGHPGVTNLCGKLSLIESTALMRDAVMNYMNDSAPMHFASAVNAPTTAIFCSTVPSFGFGPLADEARIIESSEPLECRPCGLHGHRQCPKGHFRCAEQINVERLEAAL